MVRRIDHDPPEKDNPAARAVATGEAEDETSLGAQANNYQRSERGAIASYTIASDLTVMHITFSERVLA